MLVYRQFYGSIIFFLGFRSGTLPNYQANKETVAKVTNSQWNDPLSDQSIEAQDITLLLLKTCQHEVNNNPLEHPG